MGTNLPPPLLLLQVHDGRYRRTKLAAPTSEMCCKDVEILSTSQSPRITSAQRIPSNKSCSLRQLACYGEVVPPRM